MSDSHTQAVGLGLISTRWPLITEPSQFVFRYAPAIRGYLEVLIREPHGVDEVIQDFLAHVFAQGFSADKIRRGRFRDYLSAAVRYSAWKYLRRKPHMGLTPEMLAQLEGPTLDDAPEWLAGWRRCMIDKAWEAVETHQRQSPGNWFHTVLKLSVDNPSADSKSLAGRVPAKPPLSAVAFRKQLSRARQYFGEALVAEVKKTLEVPTPEEVLDELADTGMLEFVRSYLPEGWVK